MAIAENHRKIIALFHQLTALSIWNIQKVILLVPTKVPFNLSLMFRQTVTGQS